MVQKIRKHQTGFVIAAVLVAIATIITYAWARTESNPVTYTDHQRFRSNVTINGTDANQKAAVVIGTNATVAITPAVTITGALTQNGAATFNAAVVNETYYHAGASGNLTWSYAYGNVLLLSGTTATTITLPAITAAYDGYRLVVKNLSGATTRTIAAAVGVDAIESTRGTLTGASCTVLDAAGDCREWMAVHADTVSGTSSYWMQISSNVT